MVVVISSGTGAFASVGGYRITFSASTYFTSTLSTTVDPSAGTYVYTKLTANTGRLAATDSGVGASVTQSLIFTSASTATYSISSPSGTSTGTVVLEGVTAISTSTAALANMSVRAQVPNSSQIIPGLVIANATAKVLIRVAGPALATFGVSGTLPNPKFTIFQGSTAIGSNDDWGSTSANKAAVLDAATKTGAFAFADGSKDAAIVVDLNPGAYTVVITGETNTTGEVILEVYRVP